MRKLKESENNNIKKENDYNNNDISDDGKNKFVNIEHSNNSNNKLIELKNKINNLENRIYCIVCKKNEREVVFENCRHLLLCIDCLYYYYARGNKMEVQCPLCKRVSKKFFYVSLWKYYYEFYIRIFNNIS